MLYKIYYNYYYLTIKSLFSKWACKYKLVSYINNNRSLTPNGGTIKQYNVNCWNVSNTTGTKRDTFSALAWALSWIVLITHSRKNTVYVLSIIYILHVPLISRDIHQFMVIFNRLFSLLYSYLLLSTFLHVTCLLYYFYLHKQ